MWSGSRAPICLVIKILTHDFLSKKINSFVWDFFPKITRENCLNLFAFLAQLTMSTRAFPITMCPSSVRLSGCPSVRPLDYFSKPVSSYSFSRITFKFITGIKYDVTNLACAFFDDRTIFVFLANFWYFWNNGIIYSNCKMHLLLQF